MGKHVKIHPVSPLVLRGALKYGGVEVGKLRQTSYHAEDCRATYETQITLLPANIRRKASDHITQYLNSLFSADVQFGSVWTTKAGNMYCEFATSVENPFAVTDRDPKAAPFPEGENLDGIPF